MLTFNNLTLGDLLSRAGQEARQEAEGIDIESTGEIDLLAQAQEIVSKYRREMPRLCADSIWIDYIEIKFGSNPRVEIKFKVGAVFVGNLVIQYQASQRLDAPLSVGEKQWVFTYNVGYDFDPSQTKARFRSDLEAAQRYLEDLQAEETSWAEALAADIAARLHKRRLITESVAARISAMGYPTVDRD